MNIRDYRESDCEEIANLFYDAVHAINNVYYSQKQLEAWAPTPCDYVHWKNRLEIKKPFVAVMENRLVGFIELETDGHIDCLYVHKDYHRKGIAKALFEYLCKVVIEKGINELYVEASKPAKLFFESVGFTKIKQNTITLFRSF